MVQLVLKIMEWREFSRMPVEGPKGQLIGLLTRSHLLKRIENDPTVKSKLVKDVMIKNVITAEPDDSLGKAIEKMKLHKVGCLPVISRRILIGIITETDIIKIVTENDNWSDGGN
jgi:CBS domain-containing protein